MTTPTISVILPVRNGERFLAASIESVVNQTLPPHEIIVVDGGSTDRSIEIAGAFPGVTHVAQDGDGIGAARNQGVAIASGGLIAFTADDDIWLPQKLAKQADRLAREPDLDLVLTEFQHFLEPGDAMPPGYGDNILTHVFRASISEALLVRREVFDDIGPFDPSFGISDDVEWFARARDAGLRSGMVDEVLVLKRIHAGNATVTNRKGLRRNLMKVMLTLAQRRRNDDG